MRVVPQSRFGVALLAIAAVAIVARGAHLAFVLSSPIGDVLVQDARYYHGEALRLAGFLPDSAHVGPTFMNLGYPYFLAAVYRTFGAQPAAAMVVQGLLGALTAVMLAVAAHRLLDARAPAITAGCVYAVYSGAVFYDGLVLTPSIVNFLLALSLLGAADAIRRGRFAPALAAGLAIGAAGLVRANVLLLAPLMALAFEGRTRSGRGTAGALLAGALVVPLPVVVYNGVAHREWVPVSANGGMNFWVGNHGAAGGTYVAAPFVGSQDAAVETRAYLDEARRRSGDPGMTLAASSGFWMRRGLEEIAAAPGRWILLEGKKLALFWNRFEAKTNVGLAFVREFSPVLAWLPVGFAAIALLGAGGIAVLATGRGKAAAWLPGALVVGPLLTCLGFFVSGEYRHPAALGLAVGTGVLLTSAWTGRRMPRAAAITIVLLAPLVLWPQPGAARAAHPNLDYANHARALCSGRPDGSLPSREDFRRAVDLLARARLDGAKDLAILDARLWVHHGAAVRFEDPGEAANAFEAAREILRRDPRPGSEGYSREFVVHLRRTLRGRIENLYRRGFVRDDPELFRQAGELLSGLD